MIGAAMALEQAAIDRFLGQRMPKDVYLPVGLDALVNELETAQFAQLGVEGRSALPYRAQEVEREFSTDHRSGLQKLFRFVRQSIDPRHHDIVDRVRNHEVRSKVPCLARVERELLEEKGIAIGLGDDFLG